ncbi:MAG: AzlD domain-containing protein [Oscillospiraceae bacterium]|jgi:branched-subunit amino acid transport protein AzlD|nr:AzlD domain-containing protein [Oscillospiraceae bacterium]
MTNVQAAVTIMIMAACTVATRALPFVLFGGGKRTPRIVLYLGRTLPYAIIGMLIVYCLRGVRPLTWPHALPELIGLAVTATTYLTSKRTLPAVLGGTIAYMAALRIIV